MAPPVIPAVLPGLKADLKKLCKEQGLSEDGTVAELKERLVKKRDAPADDDAPPAERAGDIPSLAAVDLQTFTADQLKDLCKKLKLADGGSKGDLLLRILDYARQAHHVDTSSSEDGWAKALKQYAPKVKLEDLELDWGLGPVLLTPSLWPVVLWREPIGRSEIYGPIGTEGRMIEALSKRWKSLLDCSQRDIQKLCGMFITLWTLIQASRQDRHVTPKSWLRDHWELQVQPIVKFMRQLQAVKMRSTGQHGIAKKIENLASVPTEQLGYDVAELAEKFAMKRGREDDETDSEDDVGNERRQRRRRRQKNTKKGVCRGCGVKATPKSGQTAKQWFEAHNATCKGNV